MIYLIAALIIAIWAAVPDFKIEGFVEGVKTFFFTLMVSVFVAMLVWFVFGSMAGALLPSEIVETTIPIVALKDGGEASGSFFLGTGSVNNEINYIFIVENSEGFAIKQIRASKAYLKYGSEPQYIERTVRNKGSLGVWIATSFFLPDPLDTIIVPEGTVTVEYEVNLE